MPSLSSSASFERFAGSARKISRATVSMRVVGRSVASSHIGKDCSPSSGNVESDPLVAKKSGFYDAL
jgi:hypothetical protein